MRLDEMEVKIATGSPIVRWGAAECSQLAIKVDEEMVKLTAEVINRQVT